METLESLRRQIEVATDLRSVVTTMKALSSVEVRDFERSVSSLNQSVKVVRYGFQTLFRNHPELVPRATTPPAGRTLAVVFGTDQGLCGPLNRLIVRHALAHLPAGDEVVVTAVGLRAARELETAGHHVAHVFDLPSSVPGIPATVRTMLVRLDELRSARRIDRVVLYHHRPTGRAGYEPRTVTVVPLDPRLLRSIGRRPWPTRRLPTFTMDPAALLECLTREAVSYSLYRAHAEARASEHTGRLTSMQNAEQSIVERLAELQRSYHQARQATITAELLDVVSGYEAVQSPLR